MFARRSVRESFPVKKAGERNGTVLVLAVAVMVMVLAFAAFTVDIGYIALTKGQLQKSSDAASLSAMIDLKEALGPGATVTATQAESNARSAVVAVAAVNRAGGRNSITADPNDNVRFGQVVWQSDGNGGGSWVKTWGVAPYNMVEVTLKRSNTGGSADGPLPMFFAPVIGTNTANVQATATAAMLPTNGFQKLPGVPGNPEILPFTLDQLTWDAMIAGGGSDNYAWNDSTKTLSSGSDGVREVDLYPYGNQLLPPGNRGTVDFGSSGNSTNDIKRQILYGLNESDLSYFGGKISFANGPLIMNGDTGLSAGFKAELETIIGKPRAIPLFTQVSGNGNNANYTLVRFVGIRILAVSLSGKDKYVIVQPATLTSVHAIPGGESISTGAILTKPILIK